MTDDEKDWKKDGRFRKGTREWQRFEAQKKKQVHKTKVRYRKAVKIEVVNPTGIECDVEVDTSRGGWDMSWDDQDMGLMLEVTHEEWDAKRKRVKVFIDFVNKDDEQVKKNIEMFKQRKIDRLRQLREEEENKGVV